ncbi:MAG: hypothetical protein Q4615_10300 [Paracoccus aminovorans]|nr:hypothetical protein [Paracoccus aminovorans]
MDVEDAYQRGHEQGLAEGRERSLDALCQALVGCRQELAASRQHETGLRREILAGLVPVLHAIVDQLAPAAQTDRLRQALLAELHRLAEHAPEQQIVLRSPVDMRPELADCLELGKLSAGPDRGCPPRPAAARADLGPGQHRL